MSSSAVTNDNEVSFVHYIHLQIADRVHRTTNEAFISGGKREPDTFLSEQEKNQANNTLTLTVFYVHTGDSTRFLWCVMRKAADISWLLEKAAIGQRP